jgi:hypothetical protein
LAHGGSLARFPEYALEKELDNGDFNLVRLKSVSRDAKAECANRPEGFWPMSLAG